MKLTIAATQIIFACCCLAQDRPLAQMTFEAVDDESKPIQDLEILVSTFDHWERGEGFGRDISETFAKTTNENGVAILSGGSLRGEFKYAAQRKLGFYGGGVGSYRFSSVQRDRWQPWNPTIRIALKRVVNPIPMYARRLGGSPRLFQLPATGKPVGFDLLLGEWVAPYGRGQHSDLIFVLTRNASLGGGERGPMGTLRVSFSNPLDGIISVISPKSGGELRMPRTAPDSDYLPQLEKQFGTSEKDQLNVSAKEDQCYFFRIRSVADTAGKIKSAHYGKILGDLSCDITNSDTGYLQFTYYVNPTSLDRNMEFDPRKNLFTDLHWSEVVTAP